MKKCLIANRGEIALRIHRTCRALGIRTVAVYSEVDADAPHARQLDEAWRLPGPPHAAYLDGAAIVAIAKASGADAVHPGFGFLSERAAFARAVTEAGLVFVGPTAAAIEAMGDKAQAKRIAEKAGVPTIPGYRDEGEQNDLACLEREGKKLGFPLLVKAIAGGGGKGMRIVRREAELAEALAAASREAESAFGDGRLLLERYFEGARHVEVQVFGDGRGEVISLLERDCSLQRRHQKVLEECPAPALPESARKKIHQAARAVAQAVQYRNAGTVEFLYAGDDEFYFLEMNTRLQVEHPVTELVCGVDLVRWQLAVAEGASVPVEPFTPRGHAVEVRWYAEDAARHFAPSTGTVVGWVPPKLAEGVRFDGAVRRGMEVPVEYDPMLGKLIAWGATREQALDRLAGALRDTALLGVTNNRGFLLRLVEHPDVRRGAVHTNLVAELVATPLDESASRQRAAEVATLVAVGEERWPPGTPESLPRGYRNNRYRDEERSWRIGESTIRIRFRREKNGTLILTGDGKPRSARVVDRRRDRVRVEIDGVQRTFAVATQPGKCWVGADDGTTFELVEPEAFPRPASAVDEARVRAPMPGRVTKLLVEVGQMVQAGAPLVVLEAMKMEQVVTATREGIVESLHVDVGQSVPLGAELLRWRTSAAPQDGEKTRK